MSEDTIAAIIIAVISSGILTTLATIINSHVQNKKSRLNTIETKVDNITTDIRKLSEDLSEHKATLARTHILRFADELHDGRYHSDEYFRQQILDIDTYNRYCEIHPYFANGLTRMASEYIREEYQKRFLTSHDDSA